MPVKGWDYTLMRHFMQYKYIYLRIFGHHGLGGSIGFCDPDAGIGFAYCCNKMHAVGTNGPRARRLIDALYA